MYGIFPRESIELNVQYLRKTFYNKLSLAQGLHRHAILLRYHSPVLNLSPLHYLANPCATLRTDHICLFTVTSSH